LSCRTGSVMLSHFLSLAASQPFIVRPLCFAFSAIQFSTTLDRAIVPKLPPISEWLPIKPSCTPRLIDSPRNIRRRGTGASRRSAIPLTAPAAAKMHSTWAPCPAASGCAGLPRHIRDCCESRKSSTLIRFRGNFYLVIPKYDNHLQLGIWAVCSDF